MQFLEITAIGLQNEILGAIFKDKGGNEVSERVKIDQYMDTNADFTSSSIEYFESYL